jgi:hypothetical protein
LSGWQGKDGPSALFVWRQGVPAPIEQQAGNLSVSESRRAEERLPRRFRMHAYCDSCEYLVEALGQCRNHVWVSTEVITPENAEPWEFEDPAEFRQRLKSLQEWWSKRRA